MRQFRGPAFQMGACLLVSLWANGASAQSVSGRLISGETDLPVSNALVILQDSVENEIARASTLASGTFTFHFVKHAIVRLRVLRIGYAPWQSADIPVNPTGVLDLDIKLPVERVILPQDIVVEGSGACRSDQESGAATVLLIEEARKAFALAEETLTGSRMRFRITSYLRTLDPSGMMLDEEVSAHTPLHDWPIESAPVDSLAQWGFVRPPSRFQRNIGLGPAYYAPDGEVLFSSWFLGGHCFSVTRDGVDGLVGLRFRPEKGSTHPDIEGTLWIEESSLELDRLEFFYVHLPSWVPQRSAGGQLQFDQLPAGGWVVRQWWLRAPVEERPLGPGASRLGGFQESGGRVVEVVDREGEHLFWMDDATN